MTNITTTVQRSRQNRFCHECNRRCIKKGDLYARHVMFPSHELYNYVDPITGAPLRSPINTNECINGAIRRGDKELLKVFREKSSQ